MGPSSYERFTFPFGGALRCGDIRVLLDERSILVSVRVLASFMVDPIVKRDEGESSGVTVFVFLPRVTRHLSVEPRAVANTGCVHSCTCRALSTLFRPTPDNLDNNGKPHVFVGSVLRVFPLGGYDNNNMIG